MFFRGRGVDGKTLQNDRIKHGWSIWNFGEKKMLEEMEVKIKDKITGETLVIVFEAGFIIRKEEENDTGRSS